MVQVRKTTKQELQLPLAPLLLLPLLRNLLPQLSLQLLPARRRNHRLILHPHVHRHFEARDPIPQIRFEIVRGQHGVGFEANDGRDFFAEAGVGNAEYTGFEDGGVGVEGIFDFEGLRGRSEGCDGLGEDRER